jgi:A/G-specific adenine glycosylase
MELRQNWEETTTRRFRRNLLRWYEQHRRALPWRDNPTPYRVWISEIMLQQTQVKTVIPYYGRFLKRFPDIGSLAEAQEREVLALWSGLGYYGRAGNLHKAARLIVKKHGEFPEEYKDIIALPGIGQYTAGAISSLAFNQARPVVDGNIQRVITRLKGIIKRPSASFFWKQMSGWLPEGKSSAFNQAMMELGAVVCVPIQPHCSKCPVESFCEARRLDIQDRIPGARTKKANKQIRIAILVLEQKGGILLTSVHKPPIIPGKWGLPCRQILKGESMEDVASKLARKMLGRTISLKPSSKISHSISCYRITAYGFFGKVDDPAARPLKTNDFRWVHSHQSGELLTSSLFRKVLQRFPELNSKQE